MKKIYWVLFFIFGFFPFASNAAPIIINHESVALYDDIPSQYMTLVKQMWFSMPGESHATAYPNGLAALQTQNSTYVINTTAPGNGNTGGTGLSIAGYLWNGSNWESGAGEEDWFYDGVTKPRSHITKVSTASYRSSILGLGWCWDAGLTPDDFDDYVNATQGYSTYAKSLNSKVHVVFTTGPVDGTGTAARDEKYAKVRTHVNNSSDEILFDYADILQYNNTGVKLNTTYGTIHPDNDGSTGAHIGNVGELRLAKAAWVLMARVAGWDGAIQQLDECTESVCNVYRFWSNGKQGHFFTQSATEGNSIIANDPSWTYEGVAYSTFGSQETNTTPIYRFWSNSKQHHFFTASQAEKESIEANDHSWAYEGISYYAYATEKANTTAVYRFWSQAKQGHFFTISQAEKESIEANDPSWHYEGIAWYVPTS